MSSSWTLSRLSGCCCRGLQSPVLLSLVSVSFGIWSLQSSLHTVLVSFEWCPVNFSLSRFFFEPSSGAVVTSIFCFYLNFFLDAAVRGAPSVLESPSAVHLQCQFLSSVAGVSCDVWSELVLFPS